MMALTLPGLRHRGGHGEGGGGQQARAGGPGVRDAHDGDGHAGGEARPALWRPGESCAVLHCTVHSIFINTIIIIFDGESSALLVFAGCVQQILSRCVACIPSASPYPYSKLNTTIALA